jgi:hypothetical protein
MKILTAISTCAFIAMAVPAFAQAANPSTSGPGTNNAQPNGAPGATGGTDPKNGGMTEGRSSVTDPTMGTTTRSNAMKNGANGATNGNMAPGGGPGEVGGASK